MQADSSQPRLPLPAAAAAAAAATPAACSSVPSGPHQQTVVQGLRPTCGDPNDAVFEAAGQGSAGVSNCAQGGGATAQGPTGANSAQGPRGSTGPGGCNSTQGGSTTAQGPGGANSTQGAGASSSSAGPVASGATTPVAACRSKSVELLSSTGMGDLTVAKTYKRETKQRYERLALSFDIAQHQCSTDLMKFSAPTIRAN